MENEVYTAVTSLLMISALSVILSYFITGTSIEKSIKVLFSVAALSIVVSLFSPIISFVLNFQEISVDSIESDQTEQNEMITAKETARQISLNTRKMLSLRLSIPEEELTVSVTVDKNDKNEYILKSITVTLDNEYEDLFGTVIDLVKSELYCECIVISK